MGEANENRKSRRSSNSAGSNSKAMENLFLEINRYPRDLLQRFMSADTTQSHTPRSEEEEEEEDEEEEEEEEDGDDKEGIELSLGLSLGGRFGVDKTPKKKLTRSSSFAGSIVTKHEAFSAPPVSYPVLMRTSSLPTETEEEWRKRKEMQSLRRMEAKRRRSEKQKSLRGGGGELNLEELNVNNSNRGNWVVPTWAKQGVNVRKSCNLQGSQQGSVESLGGTSSGLSELEGSKPAQGSSSGGEARSPASSQSLQERSSQEALGPSGTGTNENVSWTPGQEMDNPSKKLEHAENRGREIGTNTIEEMPCVFTVGNGPNGRRVDGILYKYGKGEEVRIMCICHGSFLSPAEFVKHAGGGDVDHPLRHIVVNPSGKSFS